jgi:hypothetical protein
LGIGKKPTSGTNDVHCNKLAIPGSKSQDDNCCRRALSHFETNAFKPQITDRREHFVTVPNLQGLVLFSSALPISSFPKHKKTKIEASSVK